MDYNKYDEHKKICLALNKIYWEKNTKYGDSFSLAYKKYGKKAALIQLFHKWNRIEALLANEDLDNNEESVKDSLLDFANYAIMTVMEIEKQEIPF